MKKPETYEFYGEVNNTLKGDYEVSITFFTDNKEDGQTILKLIENYLKTNEKPYEDHVRQCIKCGNTWVEK